MDQQWISVSVGVITASATLIGVAITNYFNLMAIEKRLKFEADENEKKIKLELRKEIYLAIAEDVYLLNAFIFRCINDRNARTENDVLNRLNTHISKLLLISSSAISIEADKVNEIYIKVLSALHLGLKEIVLLEFENEGLEKINESHQLEFKSLNSIFKEIKITELDNTIKVEKLELLYKDIQFIAAEINKNNNEIGINHEKIFSLKKELFIDMIDRLKIVRPSLIKLMNLMRVDFGVNEPFEFNVDSYEKKYNEFKEFTIDSLDKARS